MSDSSDWVEGLKEAVAEFEQARSSANPGVKVTLVDGESFFLSNVRPAPRHDLVVLYPYPPGMTTDLTIGEDGYPVMPRVLIVSPGAVAKIELMAEPPGQREARFGLRQSAEPEPSALEHEGDAEEEMAAAPALRPPAPDTGDSG